MGRYAFRRALREWNRNASAGHKITCYDHFKTFCMTAVYSNGIRRIEMGSHETKSGSPYQIDF